MRTPITAPGDWDVRPLASIASVRFSGVDKKTRSGETPVRLCNYTDVYKNDYLRGNESFMEATATLAEIERFGMERGDVVITKDSETPDDIGIPTVLTNESFGLVCGYHLALIRPDKDLLDPVFLAKQLSTPRCANHFFRLCNGLTRYGLPIDTVEKLPIWRPELSEQQTVARVLTQLNAAIENTERVIVKLKKIRVGLLHDLLTRGIDENGELRDPEKNPELFREVLGFGLVPREWKLFEISDIGRIASGGTPSRNVQAYWGGHVPWITPSDMAALRGDVIYIGRDKLTQAGLSNSATELLPEGTLVVTSRASLGLVAITGQPLSTNQGFKNIIPSGNWDKRYLCYLLRSLAPNMIRRASGTTFLEVSKTQFEKIKFVAPTPDANEQIWIAESISPLIARIESEKHILGKLLLIKEGLIQDLLTGRKRVPAELIGCGGATEVGGKKREANIYFKRTVLAAEIVAQFHGLPTFGRVKFHKTMFLCERVAELDLGTQYHRAAAGPYDNRFMRSVDSQMKKQGWFRRVSRGTGPDGTPMGWAYEPMEKAGGHREWFERYWADARERIQRVLDILRRLDSERCEIIATLYSAWEDLLTAGGEVADDTIVNEVLTNWHESKQAVARERWFAALGWMREQGLTPIVAAKGN